LHHPGHKDHKQVCKEQHSYLVSIVSEFVNAHTSAEDADLMRRAAKESTVIRGYLIMLLILAGIASILAFSIKAGLSVPSYITISLAIFWVAWMVIVLVMAFSDRAQITLVLIWLYIRYTPVQRLTEMLARFLDRANPGHALRWVAFILILLGFHLDLLSS